MGEIKSIQKPSGTNNASRRPVNDTMAEGPMLTQKAIWGGLGGALWRFSLSGRMKDLKSENQKHAYRAARKIADWAKAGKNITPALELLEQRLSHENRLIRLACADAICNGTDKEELLEKAVWTLNNLLLSENPEIKEYAPLCLIMASKRGESVAIAYDNLRRLVETTYIHQIRNNAAFALGFAVAGTKDGEMRMKGLEFLLAESMKWHDHSTTNIGAIMGLGVLLCADREDMRKAASSALQELLRSDNQKAVKSALAQFEHAILCGVKIDDALTEISYLLDHINKDIGTDAVRILCIAEEKGADLRLALSDLKGRDTANWAREYAKNPLRSYLKRYVD
jgi:hypothetical protein